MKIVHISDIHWRGISRHKEYTNSFERLYEKLRDINPDLIINTGDTFHTKTQGITPEIIERISWMFKNLHDIATTVHILGNHDGNLNNLNRTDIISSIHELSDSGYLMKNSGMLPIGDHNDFHIYAFSPFDKAKKGAWNSVYDILKKRKQEYPDAINLALFHGSVYGCRVDSNFQLPNGEAEVVDFTGFDFALLGDIHLNQNIAYRLDRNGVAKPWIAYPGSLIQQNFGETRNKGFLVWELRAKDDWDVEFVELENKQPFITVDWDRNYEETIDAVKSEIGIIEDYPGARYRIKIKNTIPESQKEALVEKLKKDYCAEEVVFKTESHERLDEINMQNSSFTKKSLREDPDSLMSLLQDFMSYYPDKYNLNNEELASTKSIIQDYLQKLERNDDGTRTQSNRTWNLHYLEFSNLYRYGENNRVDFENYNGLVGIFGPNRAGKSSIIGALMYALFNTTDRGSIKNVDIINKQKNKASAKVEFTVGGRRYRVERSTTRIFKGDDEDTGKVENTVNLFEGIFNEEYKSYVWKSRNGISTTDTDKKIRNKIGSSEDFLLTAFSAQGDLNKFINEGSTNRKKHLGRFLELDVFHSLFNYAKEDFIVLQKTGNVLTEEEWNVKIGKQEKDLKKHKTELKKVNKKKKKAQDKIFEEKTWLESHKKENVYDSSDLEKIESQIQATQNKLEKKLEKLLQNEETIKSNQEAILAFQETLSTFKDESELKREQQEFEKLEKTLLELKNEAKDEDSKLKRLKDSSKKLKTVPCGDEFPTCRFIKDSHEDKEKIEEQKELLASVQETLKKVIDEHKVLKSSDAKATLKKIGSLNSKISNLSNVISLSQETSKRLKLEQKSLEETLKTLEEKQTKILDSMDEAYIKEVEEHKRTLETLEKELHLLEKQIGSLNQGIGTDAFKLKKLIKEREESSHLASNIAIHSLLQDAFSKRGIPAMILKTQLPIINSELEKIIPPDVGFTIELETQSSSNFMDIYLNDGESRRIIELCSGMEKTLCSLALRVALINLSSLPKPNFFVIDEGFGFLDSENQSKCLSILGTLSFYFNSVYIISHIDPIKDIVDHVIEISSNIKESSVRA